MEGHFWGGGWRCAVIYFARRTAFLVSPPQILCNGAEQNGGLPPCRGARRVPLRRPLNVPVCEHTGMGGPAAWLYLGLYRPAQSGIFLVSFPAGGGGNCFFLEAKGLISRVSAETTLGVSPVFCVCVCVFCAFWGVFLCFLCFFVCFSRVSADFFFFSAGE